MKNYFNSAKALTEWPRTKARPTIENSICASMNLYQRVISPRATAAIKAIYRYFIDSLFIVKRVQVHALLLYATPPILASTTPAIVPGATVSATPVSFSALLMGFLQTLDFSQVLILILIGSLFFKDEIRILMTKYFKLPANGSGTAEKLQTTMNQLQHHYNDETTHILTDILEESRRHTQKLDVVIDNSKSILNRQDEMIKYGVPERK